MIVYLQENMRKMKMSYDSSIIATPVQADEAVTLD